MHEPTVQRVHIIHQPIERAGADDVLAPRRAHAVPRVWVAEEPQDSVCEARFVSGRRQAAGGAVEHDRRSAADMGAHDGYRRGLCFDQADGRALVVGCQCDDIACEADIWHVPAKARPREARGELRANGRRLKLSAQLAIAYDGDPGLGVATRDLRGDPQESVHPASSARDGRPRTSRCDASSRSRSSASGRS